MLTHDLIQRRFYIMNRVRILVEYVFVLCILEHTFSCHSDAWIFIAMFTWYLNYIVQHFQIVIFPLSITSQIESDCLFDKTVAVEIAKKNVCWKKLIEYVEKCQFSEVKSNCRSNSVLYYVLSFYKGFFFASILVR